MKLKTNKLILSGAILASMAITTVSHAADLTASSTSARIWFNDTNSAGNEWQISGWDNFFGIFNWVNSHYVLSITPSVNSSNSLSIDSSGDINLASGSVFIDRSAKRMGIGTSAPESDLHIKTTSSVANLVMESTGSKWQWYNGGTGLWAGRLSSPSGNPFKLQNTAPGDSIVANSTGVGIGTASPATALHVRKSGAVLRVEDTNGTTGIRNLLELRNKGPVGFKLRDTTGVEDWAFRTGGGGSFIATKSDISGPVMSFGGDGSVSLGQNPGSAGTTSNMFLSPVGNLTIQGAFITPFNTYADYVFDSDYKLMPLDELQTFVKANKHLPDVLSEAEVKKTNMINVSELQITQLAKIEELTLYTLQQHKQIKALQEKDEQTIALNKKQDERTNANKERLDQQAMTLKAENNSLKERLASLEKLVTNLAMGSGQLTKGAKLALK